MKRLKTSWWSKARHNFRPGSVRERASQWSQKYCGPVGSAEWQAGFDGYIAGHLEATRAKMSQAAPTTHLEQTSAKASLSRPRNHHDPHH